MIRLVCELYSGCDIFVILLPPRKIQEERVVVNCSGHLGEPGSACIMLHRSAVRQISTGQEVTFEELKAAIIQRQSRPEVKADS